jgi:small subunit ribosomal protein S16
MLVIRLFRVGKKNQPSFKIVVTDKRKAPKAGRFVEEVGFYNPLKKEKVLKTERIKYWLSVGAKPSDTLYNLLVSEKVIEGKKVRIYIKKTKKEKEPAAKAPDEKKVEEKLPQEQKPEEKLPKETSKEGIVRESENKQEIV